MCSWSSQLVASWARDRLQRTRGTTPEPRRSRGCPTSANGSPRTPLASRQEANRPDLFCWTSRASLRSPASREPEWLPAGQRSAQAQLPLPARLLVGPRLLFCPLRHPPSLHRFSLPRPPPPYCLSALLGQPPRFQPFPCRSMTTEPPLWSPYPSGPPPSLPLPSPPRSPLPLSPPSLSPPHITTASLLCR